MSKPKIKRKRGRPLKRDMVVDVFKIKDEMKEENAKLRYENNRLAFKVKELVNLLKDRDDQITALMVAQEDNKNSYYKLQAKYYALAKKASGWTKNETKEHKILVDRNKALKEEMKIINRSFNNRMDEVMNRFSDMQDRFIHMVTGVVAEVKISRDFVENLKNKGQD